MTDTSSTAPRSPRCWVRRTRSRTPRWLTTQAFISGGGKSDLYLVMVRAHHAIHRGVAYVAMCDGVMQHYVQVRTGDDSPRGISCLAIEKDSKGSVVAHTPPPSRCLWSRTHHRHAACGRAHTAVTLLVVAHTPPPSPALQAFVRGPRT